ncbi:hypothetical protein Taro_040175 [Colocasia esculenta]|uniref:Uncharacterized protein n=1 Tax=Colocasia esculenta TaxID=4460 RepID=A0A843WHY1_COLES|nr:hypothetical protein [Colocasia esculenta]
MTARRGQSLGAHSAQPRPTILAVFSRNRLHTTKAHLHGFITRDMFLLENQVPFVVLNALMSLRSVKYEEFVRRKITGDTSIAKNWWWWSTNALERGAEEGPAHLLDVLRTELLGRTKSRTCCLRDVEFSVGLVFGQLQLPPIVVDGTARPKFLNLIAMEMCPDSSSDYGVTSYICLLDSLIDHADDVKELRRKRILLNGLGSDQQVADLFNEFTTGLLLESFLYAEAIRKIDKHCSNKNKVSFARMLHTYFSSTWTAISFFAALLLILLAITQTLFTIFPKFAINKH